MARAEFLQALTPKVGILRGLRGFMRAQGYNRSYILRYLTLALTETVAQVKVKGLSTESLLKGLRFPVKQVHGRYPHLRIEDLGSEVKGFALGIMNISGFPSKSGIPTSLLQNMKPTRRRTKQRTNKATDTGADSRYHSFQCPAYF